MEKCDQAVMDLRAVTEVGKFPRRGTEESVLCSFALVSDASGAIINLLSF